MSSSPPHPLSLQVDVCTCMEVSVGTMCTYFCATCATDAMSLCQHCMHEHCGHQVIQVCTCAGKERLLACPSNLMP
eukprot:366029-Chlamydomonas_euryale.AAC.9